MVGVGNDCLNPIYVNVNGDKYSHLRVACGHCINCKIARKKEWSIRLQMELTCWSDCSFVTLTYDDAHVPVFSDLVDVHTLDGSDFTRWMKRFRKAYKKPFRYFAVGEYGTKSQRPHYHLIMFGIGIDEATRYCLSTWKKGFVDVRSVSPETCSYISGYVQKKLYGNDAYDFRNPEFMRCSKHLGERWLIENFHRLDPDRPVVSINGFEYVIPRQLRRLASDEGWCCKHHFTPFPKIDAQNWLEIQKAQLYQLQQFCAAEGVSLSDYFRNRLSLAKNHQTKVLSSRNMRGV